MSKKLDRIHERRMEHRRKAHDPNVADNLDVRSALIKRIETGELTPEEAQAELRKIKRLGKKAGLETYHGD